MTTTTKDTKTPTLPAPGLWEKEEAAAYLRLSVSTILRLVRAGELPHFRIGRSLRFRREDLDGYIGELAFRGRYGVNKGGKKE